MRMGMRYVLASARKSDFESKLSALAAASIRLPISPRSRSQPPRNRRARLCGCIRNFGLTRRDAMWNAAAVELDPNSLLAGVKPWPWRSSASRRCRVWTKRSPTMRRPALPPGRNLMTYLREQLARAKSSER